METRFDGIAGRVAGHAMAVLNRDMELAAIDELAPSPGDHLLAIGFGPGVGIELLAARLTSGVVRGIDPSGAMVDQATARNRQAVAEERVDLRQAGAGAIPWPDDTFDGAVAVNSMQLWEPLDGSVAEVMRVLRPGAPLVGATHVWAIEKRLALPSWISVTADLFARGGRTQRDRTARFRSGTGLVVTVR